MASRDLSLCVCYTGTRGSGKTLTMSIHAFHKMAYADKKVWSNYPIAATAVFPDGTEKYCQAIPLNMDAIYTFDKGLAKGIVCIDEVNLWSDSRRSMSVTNRLMNSILTLIRHRQLSFYFTVQNESWLDNRVRFQLDELIHCQDLAFKYPKLERGNFIQLEARDMSGFTGHSYLEEGRTYIQTLQRGKDYWGIYNTESEFDVLETQTKYEVQTKTKTIMVGDEFADGEKPTKGFGLNYSVLENAPN